MTAFALLLAMAAAAYGLARLLRLPSIPVLIGAGMSLGLTGLVPKEFGLGNAVGEGAIHVLELGLVFLVFASGVELNPESGGVGDGRAVFTGDGCRLPMRHDDGDG